MGETVAAPASEIGSDRGDITIRPADDVFVSYVTLRNRTGDDSPEAFYGGTRDRIRTGTCTVTFSPIWGLEDMEEAAPIYIPDEKIELKKLEEQPEKRFWSEIDSFTRHNVGNIVLYIHGYNIGFGKSCRRAAIFQRALGLNDRLLLFSWPADDNLLKYTWDESDLVWSVSYLKYVLEGIVKRIGNGKLDIVAHSLGARGAVQALTRMACHEPATPFLNELVLIAPDIDTDIFRQYLPDIHQLVRRITIYVSKKDKPLKLSHKVHGYPRLGEAGENLTVFKDVETIDISLIGTRRLSGHLYQLFNPAVIKDLTRLLNAGESASRRPTLQIVHHNDLPYWQTMPED